MAFYSWKKLAGIALVSSPLWALSVGCGGGDKPATPAPKSGPATTEPAAKPTPTAEKPAAGGSDKLASEGLGTIKGRFVLKGEAPTLPPLDSSSKDKEVCAANPVPDESLVVDAGSKGIKNVFFYLPRKPSRIHADIEKPVQTQIDFDQKGCVFLTHAMAFHFEQELQLKNSDPISHNTNINTPSAGNTNPILTAGASPAKFKFSRQISTPTAVKCNIHPWMIAYMLPLNHPYFAVSGAQGEFTIEKVPAGELEFRVWHEKKGNVTGGDINAGNLTVKVEADKETELTIELTPSDLGF